MTEPSHSATPPGEEDAQGRALEAREVSSAGWGAAWRTGLLLLAAQSIASWVWMLVLAQRQGIDIGSHWYDPQMYSLRGIAATILSFALRAALFIGLAWLLGAWCRRWHVVAQAVIYGAVIGIAIPVFESLGALISELVTHPGYGLDLGLYLRSQWEMFVFGGGSLAVLLAGFSWLIAHRIILTREFGRA